MKQIFRDVSLFLLLGTALLVLASSPARATWSITAVDPVTREVGVAGATCNSRVELLAKLAPGRGAIAAQAVNNTRARDHALELLRAGERPTDILTAITADHFDRGRAFSFKTGAQTRQYGIVALGSDAPATFTGSRTFGWAGTRSAPGVTVQGNLLRSPDVVDAAMAAYHETPDPACPPRLADRLLAALLAGAEAGGDRRCTRELSALSAFMKVARPDDPPTHPSLDLVAPHGDDLNRSALTLFRQFLFPERKGSNPIHRLRTLYDTWRDENPRTDCGAGVTVRAADPPRGARR